MKLHRRFLVILYVGILLFTDPRMMHAGSMSADGEYASEQEHGTVRLSELKGGERVRICYELDGGENSPRNPDSLGKTDLPFMPAVPKREGYNFAGWYTDGSYKEKITRITRQTSFNGEQACITLYAKWTAAIDNRQNVEMYSYSVSGGSSDKKKKLRDCNYNFREDVVIPGMPSTREQDYLENIISSEGQCLQGLCFTPELILMTSYAESSKKKGSLLVFDRESGDYLVTLAMREDSHLGGIAFDGSNIWVCHSKPGTLERIPYGYIKRLAAQSPGYCVDVTIVSDEYPLKNTPSCITSYGDRIWVATHTKLFNSEMVSYSYNATNDTLQAVSRYEIPSKVQGIAFDERGSVYLSTSYGRENSSYLNVYSSLLGLANDPNNPSVKVEMPPCAEEIAIADNNVYVIFESASRKYFEGTDGNGTSTSPLDKMLEVTTASIW